VTGFMRISWGSAAMGCRIGLRNYTWPVMIRDVYHH
jgi:hypothetical protein